MSKNTNLQKAKNVKNDEFYTQYEDIEKELKHYIKHFDNKTIFCNCDDPEYSNFWKYFIDNFNDFKLKKLISTHYLKGKKSYKLEYDGRDIKKTQLKEDGDFRSEECIEILKESDIVITNPPFSLFREYIALLIKYKKKFVVIGNMNAVKYKEIFPYIKKNELWLGNNFVKAFIRPDKIIQKFGNICWYTNLDSLRRHDTLKLYKSFSPLEYFKYDNYDAIEVGRIANIPYDYKRIMGVPISFICKYNPEQFEIIGELNHGCDNEYDFAKPILNGKELYPRFLIRRRMLK